MKTVYASIAAAAMMVAPAAAAKGSYADTQIGDWFVGGADGACSAGTQKGDTLVLFVSADGDNEGAIFVTNQAIKDMSPDSAGGQSIKLTVDGADVGGGAFSSDPPGYFSLYSMHSQMAKLGDTARVTVTLSGMRAVDVTLSGVQRVIGELLRCDAQVS